MAPKKTDLNERDWKTLYLLAIRGLTLNQLGEEIGLSYEGCKSIVARLHTLLGTQKREGLARYYVKMGGKIHELAGRDAAWDDLVLNRRQIAILASMGWPDQQIASSLSMNINTVKAGLKTVYNVLHIAGRVQLPAVLANLSTSRDLSSLLPVELRSHYRD